MRLALAGQATRLDHPVGDQLAADRRVQIVGRSWRVGRAATIQGMSISGSYNAQSRKVARPNQTRSLSDQIDFAGRSR